MHVLIEEDVPMQVDSSVETSQITNLKFQVLNTFNEKIHLAYYNSSNQLVIVYDDKLEV